MTLQSSLPKLQISHHFELINYSEWGTRVDGALYACDVNRASTDPLPSDEAEAEARAAAVREIVWRKQPKMPRYVYVCIYLWPIESGFLYLQKNRIGSNTDTPLPKTAIIVKLIIFTLSCT